MRYLLILLLLIPACQKKPDGDRKADYERKYITYEIPGVGTAKVWVDVKKGCPRQDDGE